jgi:hypothetical protein
VEWPRILPKSASKKGEEVAMSDAPAAVESVPASPASVDAPAWVADELPSRNSELARQIAELQEKLREETRKYEGVASVLWQTGPPLAAGVRELFAALEYDCTAGDESATFDVAVDLGEDRRLLLLVVGGREPIGKKAPEIARVLTTIQEEAGSQDRVVVAANIFAHMPLKSRNAEPVEPEALRILQGLGANVVTTGTLFGLWRYALEDLSGARESVSRLHSLDGGMFR